MSRPLTTRWYIGSWVVCVLAWVALMMTLRNNAGVDSPPPVAMLLYVVLFAAAVVMLVFWIGALIMLAHLRAWSWFTAVLVLHLIGLGIHRHDRVRTGGAGSQDDGGDQAADGHVSGIGSLYGSDQNNRFA